MQRLSYVGMMVLYMVACLAWGKRIALEELRRNRSGPLTDVEANPFLFCTVLVRYFQVSSYTT